MKYIASVNFYCKGIQAAIQAGHALDQLWSELTEAKKPTKTTKAKFAMLREFSKNHKTWIILNGGDHNALADLHRFMTGQTTYPFTMFQEPGLNYANTAVGIILPERMYDDVATAVGRAMLKAETDKINPGNVPAQVPKDMFDEFLKRHYTPWELEFLKRKNLCGLAS